MNRNVLHISLEQRGPFMSYLGLNQCTGNGQFLHYDGEYARIVEFSDDNAACNYRDALSQETPFLPLYVGSQA